MTAYWKSKKTHKQLGSYIGDDRTNRRLFRLAVCKEHNKTTAIKTAKRWSTVDCKRCLEQKP